jgi:membrane protein implicated in regulation of membrane protease activity
MNGQKKTPGSQTIFSLVSVSLKFILEMVLALIWFLVAKKTEVSSVILFFVLYLAFTLFSILHILNTLKNKSLQIQD